MSESRWRNSGAEGIEAMDRFADLPSPSVEGGEPTTEAEQRLRDALMSVRGWREPKTILGLLDAALAEARAGAASTEATERPDLRAAARGVVQAWNAGARTGMGLTPMWTAMEDLVAALAGASPSEPSRDHNAMTPAEELDDMSDWAGEPEKHAAWCNLSADHEGLCDGDQ